MLEIKRITPNAVRAVKDKADDKFPKVVQYKGSLYTYGTHTSQTEIAAVYYSPAWLHEEVSTNE